MKYPTTPFEEGYKGKCVKLVTMDTGPLGLLKKIRLAAGNLFIGSFDTQNVMDKPREATSFGRPFDKKPSKLRGFYKYTHGERLQNEYGETIPGETDRGDIYAVFYRNHDSDGNEVVLNGDDVKTNPHIVAIAQVNDINDAAEWTEFEADFVYSTEVDMKLVENRAYNLAIVCSSSRDGAYFRGAIGSTLMIDEVELICTKTEK